APSPRPWRPGHDRRAPAWRPPPGWGARCREYSPSGDEPQSQVFIDQPRVAVSWVTVATGPSQLAGHHVTVAKVHGGLATDLLLTGGAGVDNRPAQPPGPPALHPEGPEAVALGKVRELDRLAEDAHVPPYPQPAPVLAPTARVRNELEALHDHGRGRLD